MTTGNERSAKPVGETLLEALAALFVILGPAFLSCAVKGRGLYAVFVAAAAVFALRLAETKKIHISFNILAGAALTGYALLGLLWADKLYSHIRLIFLMLTVLLFALLAADYFSAEKDKDVSVRLRYMLILSALVCALWNIAYWCFAMKLSLKRPFSAGLGQNDFLGVFMFAGLCCLIRACLENKRVRRPLWACAVPMIFVFIMSRSAAAVFVAAAFTAVYLAQKGKKALCVPFGAAAAVFLAIWAAGFDFAPFADALVCGLKNPAGLGGGGFVSAQGLYQSVYYRVDALPLAADAASSFGIVGLAAAALILARTIYLAAKNKAGLNAFAAVLCFFMFFSHAESSFAGAALAVCVLVYMERLLGKASEINCGIGRWIAAVLLGAAAIYGTVLGVGDGFYAKGLRQADSDKAAAVQSLSSAGELNPFNGECEYAAAAAGRLLYEESGNKAHIIAAEYHIKRAVEREPNNAAYYAEYAAVLESGGDYAASAEMGEEAAEKAPRWEDLRVDLARRLYRLMENTEKGSVEAQRLYQKILDCGEAVEDMEKKKQINDCADKAQPFIRMEFDYDYAEEGEGGE